MNESPVPVNSNETLDEKEALALASLMEAHLKEKGVRRPPTAEDYAQALEAVEELRKAAEEETDAKKMLFRAGRILHNAGRVGIGVPVIIVDYFFFSLMTLFPGGEDAHKATGRTHPQITQELLEGDKEISEMLTDAAKKLRLLERRARRAA